MSIATVPCPCNSSYKLVVVSHRGVRCAGSRLFLTICVQLSIVVCIAYRMPNLCRQPFVHEMGMPELRHVVEIRMSFASFMRRFVCCLFVYCRGERQVSAGVVLWWCWWGDGIGWGERPVALRRGSSRPRLVRESVRRLQPRRPPKYLNWQTPGMAPSLAIANM